MHSTPLPERAVSLSADTPDQTELAPHARGTAISLFAFFFFLGQATGPQLLGSILKSNGYAAAFIVAGLGLFTTAFVSRLLFAQSRG